MKNLKQNKQKKDSRKTKISKKNILIKEFRNKIEKAFENLRKKGYSAKMDCGDCLTGGREEILELCKKEGTQKAIFFHDQDAWDIKDWFLCNMAWIGDANEIIDCFKEQGLETEWEGSELYRIIVKYPKGRKFIGK